MAVTNRRRRIVIFGRSHHIAAGPHSFLGLTPRSAACAAGPLHRFVSTGRPLAARSSAAPVLRHLVSPWEEILQAAIRRLRRGAPAANTHPRSQPEDGCLAVTEAMIATVEIEDLRRTVREDWRSCAQSRRSGRPDQSSHQEVSTASVMSPLT